MEKYLSTKEVADVMGMSKNTAYKFIKLQGFPKIKIGKRYFVPEKKLEEYLQKHIGSKIIID